jgi:hypothetical protein
MKTSNVGIQLIQEFESLHDDLTMIGLQPKNGSNWYMD